MKQLKTIKPTQPLKGTMVTLSANVTDDNSIHGVANSLTKTRNGVTVTEEAVTPILGKTVPLLLSHNWDALPIGEATMTQVGSDGLEYTGTIFESAPNREQILEGVRNGVLSVSVGFGVTEATEDMNILGMDLFELSITPIPADAQATVTQSLQFDKMEDVKNMAVEPQAQPQAPAQPEPKAPAEDPKDNATLSDVVTALNSILDAVKALAKDGNSDDKGTDTPADAPKTPADQPEVKQSLDKIARKVVQLKSKDRKGEIELLQIIKNLGGQA